MHAGGPGAGYACPPGFGVDTHPGLPATRAAPATRRTFAPGRCVASASPHAQACKRPAAIGIHHEAQSCIGCTETRSSMGIMRSCDLRLRT
eukprot:5257330-Prymnesium_polylepis.2